MADGYARGHRSAGFLVQVRKDHHVPPRSRGIRRSWKVSPGGGRDACTYFPREPGLSASELVTACKAGIKTEVEGDEEVEQAARRRFVAGSVARRPGTSAIAGRTQVVRGFMVTLMVKLRKLIGKLITFYGRPSRRVSIVNEGVISRSVRFRSFLGYKIVPDFTRFYHFLPRTCIEGARRWH